MNFIFYWLDFAAMPALTLYAWCEATFAPGFILAGYLSWVLVEYGIHRFVFHNKHTLYHRPHMTHHKKPMATEGFPSPGLSIMALGFVGLWAQIALGLGYGMAWWSGFLIGYQTYIWSHHAIHAGWLGPWSSVRQRHDIHHRGWAFNYNLLCPLGDLIFGTYRRKRP